MYKAEKTISWFSRNISKCVVAGSYKVKKHSIRSALCFGAERVPFFYSIHSSRLLRCDYRKTSSSLLPKKAPQELFLYGRLRFPLSKTKSTPFGVLFDLAQREGFEPSVRCTRTHDFQSCSFGLSDISA